MLWGRRSLKMFPLRNFPKELLNEKVWQWMIKWRIRLLAYVHSRVRVNPGAKCKNNIFKRSCWCFGSEKYPGQTTDVSFELFIRTANRTWELTRLHSVRWNSDRIGRPNSFVFSGIKTLITLSVLHLTRKILRMWCHLTPSNPPRGNVRDHDSPPRGLSSFCILISRHISAAINRKKIARDQTCRFPSTHRAINTLPPQIKKLRPHPSVPSSFMVRFCQSACFMIAQPNVCNFYRGVTYWRWRGNASSILEDFYWGTIPSPSDLINGSIWNFFYSYVFIADLMCSKHFRSFEWDHCCKRLDDVHLIPVMDVDVTSD